jgi:long-chain acyl-CoA synthetase
MEADRTLVDLFFDRAARWSEHPAFRYWHDGAWQTVPWAEYTAAVREVAAAVERLNAGRAPAERIRAWCILPRGLTVAGGELTPTLKVKRSLVIERFAELVEEMDAR